MKKFFAEFKKFIARGNVVDMAVGVAVANAFTAIVKAFTNGFISPLIALLSNGADMADLKWVIREAVSEIVDGEEVVVTAEVSILWGAFLQAILDFLIIALALFIVLKVATAFAERAKKVHERIDAKIREDEIAAAEAKAAEEKAKAEAEAKEAEEKAKAEAEEAEAKAKAEEEARLAREKAERERLEREEALLTEIRDLLKAQSSPK